ncbi:hypothetical protein RJT34_02787 [Clitoria ternatea]|uniref:Uncharacterized protein n=1 Tax=Clitoria ternatea TaxID=43366 RepID=A0AAN9KJ16_CLITE
MEVPAETMQAILQVQAKMLCGHQRIRTEWRDGDLERSTFRPRPMKRGLLAATVRIPARRRSCHPKVIRTSSHHWSLMSGTSLDLDIGVHVFTSFSLQKHEGTSRFSHKKKVKRGICEHLYRSGHIQCQTPAHNKVTSSQVNSGVKI